MQRFDTIIHGGTLVTAAVSMRCDVGIRDGRIAALRCAGTGSAVVNAIAQCEAAWRAVNRISRSDEA